MFEDGSNVNSLSVVNLQITFSDSFTSYFPSSAKYWKNRSVCITFPELLL